MAVSLVQRTPNSDSPGGGYPLDEYSLPAFGQALAAGNLVVVPIARYHPSAVEDWDDDVTVIDSGSRSYVLEHPSVSAGSGSCCLAYSAGITADVGSPSVVTIDTDVSFNGLHAHAVEFTGVESGGHVDEGHATGSNTSPQVTTVGTSAQPGDLAVAMCAIAGGGTTTMSVPSGWNTIGLENDIGSVVGYCAAWKEVTSGGAQSAAFGTLSSAEDWSASILIFRATAGGGDEEEGDYTAGGEFGDSFAATVSASRSISAGIEAGASISASASAMAALVSAVQVGNSFSGKAAAIAAIIESIAAGDTDAASQAVERALSAGVIADEQYVAIAQVAAAIQAGLEAGEAWAAIAAAEAGITAGAELGATFASETQSAQSAALEAGTNAAAQFLGAVAAYGLLSSGASASDAFAASARIAGSVSAGIEAGAAFVVVTGDTGQLTASIALQSVFAAESAAIAQFSAHSTLSAAFTAVSEALGLINVGVILGATFSAASSADVSIIGATASVRAIRRMSASVRAIRPTATIN